MAKYADREAVHGARLELLGIAADGALRWRVGVTLGEDGRVAPTLALSGRASPGGAGNAGAASSLGNAAPALVPMTLRATWRLVFALDTDAPDRVEELEFALAPALGNRRPMTRRALATEAFRRVAPEGFRRWRVADTATGAGYLVEALEGGQDWLDRRWNWTRFELALTRARDCERHALGDGGSGCGGGLDAFVDGEALDGASPALWISRTRVWRPRREDLPLITPITLGTSVLPFDWTARSPFAGE